MKYFVAIFFLVFGTFLQAQDFSGSTNYGSTSNLSSDQQLALKSLASQNAQASAQPTPTPTPQPTPGPSLQPLPEKLSPVEKLYEHIYSENKDTAPLRQYGYDITKPFHVPLAGNVLPSYVLGPGDELTLYVWGDPVDLGAIPPLSHLVVSKSGGVFYAPVGLLPASGLTLGELQKTLKQEMARKFKHFDLTVTVSQIRQFSVLVTGFVQHPGLIPITSGYDLLSVLQAAGGVSKNGSLRSIVWTSADGQTHTIDLYKLLMYGKPLKISFNEGDSLYVPPLGTTVAVAGAVLRPAIYEALPDETLKDFLSMAGGAALNSAQGQYRVTTLQGGTASVAQGSIAQSNFSQQTVKAPTLLELYPGSLQINNGVYAEGPLYNPGWFLLANNRSLASVLKNLDFEPSADMGRAVILRTAPETNVVTAVSFDPIAVLNGKADVTLEPRDKLVFFQNQTKKDVVIFGAVQKAAVVPWRTKLELNDVLGAVSFQGDPRNLMVRVFQKEPETSADENNRLVQGKNASGNAEGQSNTNSTQFDLALLAQQNQQKQQNSTVPTLKSTTEQRPREKNTIHDVYLRDYLTSPDSKPFYIEPGARLEVLPIPSTIPSQMVVLNGAVARPGTYPLIAGMKLTDLIAEAGGVTKNAFLTGIVINRKTIVSGQKAEVNKVTLAMKLQIADLESQLPGITDPISRAALLSKISAQKTALSVLQADLANSLGRLNIQMPSTYAQLKGSQVDVSLEDGDKIFIPQVPSYVLAVGAVYNQSAQAYLPGETVGDVLSRSGGISPTGDASKVYVVRANGLVESSINHQFLFWNNFNQVKLGPGDAVVVPASDQNAVDAWAVFKDSVNILGTLVGTTANTFAILKTLGLI